MKVLFITDFFGNTLTYIENELAKQFIRFGFEVSVVCSLTDDPFDFFNDDYHTHKQASVTFCDGIKIYRQPYFVNIKNRIKKIKGLYNILVYEKPDLIFINGIQLDLREAVRYKVKKNCKIIVYSEADHSNSANNWLSLHVLHKILWKNVFQIYKKHISRLFFATPASSEFLHEVYKIPVSDSELLMLGCDYEQSESIRTNFDTDSLKKKLNIPQSDYIIITGGKLNPRKKTEIVIEAVNILDRRDVHLIVFGAADIGFEEYYNNLVKIGSNAHIHFTGWLSADLFYQYMAIADIAVFPSSQSVLWQQAIGMHLPLIAGDSGWQDMSYLNFCENIIKIDKDSITPIKFAETIEELISAPEYLSRMKKGAEEAAKKYLDYKIIAKKVLECFDDNLPHKD